MIKTINAWRGLFALFIVLHHLNVTWAGNMTWSGMTFFFIVSGFLLALRHPFTSLDARTYGRFVARHALRLYPLHWLSLALLLLLWTLFAPRHIDGTQLTINALLLHAWVPSHEVHYNLFNPVSWFLSTLLFCYLCYPLLAHGLLRWRLRHKLLLVAALALILSVIVVPLNIPQRDNVHVNPLSHVLDLTLGITLAHAYRWLRPRCLNVSRTAVTWLEIGAALLLIVTCLANTFTPLFHPWEDDVLWLIPIAAIILVATLFNGREGGLGRLMCSRPWQWLGDISFELMMLQFVAFILFCYLIAPLLGHYGIDIYHELAWASLPVVFALAWAVHRWFTLPIRRWLKRIGL